VLERVLRVLEYPKIIEQLGQHVSSSLGKEKVNQLTPSFIYEEVKQAQQSTFEGATVLRLKGYVPLGGISDIRPSIKRAAVGGTLNPTELNAIASTLYGGRQLKIFLEGFIEERGQDLPVLKQLVSQISSLKTLEQEITSCIDDQGMVVDSASPALRQIRAQIRSSESRIREKLNQMTKITSYQKMLQDPIVTIRNDRYCLPVKQEYRTHFGGIVHDQSASGATLFIEPEAVVAINNQLREAKLKEEREIDKILRELTASVALEVDSITLNVTALAELDFIFAKANYAKKLRAIQPRLNQNGYFNLKKARHPLITDDEIVPISFDLGREYTSMIITGPNTGGKTVTLKTLGLLTLMTCSGLAIPAEEESEIAVVSAVYADIGDEQSIEQSLSTFSSHMTNIVRILQEVDHKSLILFDELGAGTDPTEGAALAMSILDHVYQRGARVVATTHYSELKAYAYTKSTVMNASVEFDVETLRPTYRLLVGVPGRSNAFSIAKRLGLSESIIEQAKGQIGDDDSRVETMIASLEENQKLAEIDRLEAHKQRKEIEQLRQDLQNKEDKFEREKDKRIEAAEKKAQEHLSKAMKEAEEVIAELRNTAANREPVKEHILIDAKKKLESLTQSAETQKTKKSKTGIEKKKTFGQLKPGDEVFVHSFGQKGHVVEQVSDYEYQVQIGIMKMKVEKSQLEKIKREPTQMTPRASVRKSSEPIKMELDLRGQTIDEAIYAIDKYLDDATMANYHQVHVIHGKGTGQLRKGVQEYLKRHRNVKNMRLGGAGEGGSGVTVVELS
jgi:DNA mismatch repair protein MutS2